jgi:iron complex outermembrane receptor protein
MKLVRFEKSRIRRYGGFLLLVLCTQFSAFAQSLSEKQVTVAPGAHTVKALMMQIEKETGCTFAYSRELSDVGKSITPEKSLYKTGELLQEISGKTGLSFRVKDNIIIVRQKGRGHIRGTVRTRDGEPAGYVTISLRGRRSTQTDEAGNFKMENVESGDQAITASYIGLQTQSKQVSVTDGETVILDFVLPEDAKTLQEVIVDGGRRNKFAVRESEHAALMPLKNLENPQVYSSIPKELLTEQIITDFGNILRSSAGVYKIQGNRGINTDGASFYTLRGFRTEASLVDGVPAQTNGEVDPANIERIEVLKGPSGTLYGGVFTSFGGMINIVSKKPIDTFGGNVSYTAGSFSLNRIAADVYGPVNKSGNLLMRVNAAYQSQGSFQDAGFRRTSFIAPTLEYRMNERLTLHLNAGFYHMEGTSPAVIFLNRTRQFIARTPDELHFDWTRAYTSNDLTIKTPTVNVRGQVNYKLSGNWSSRTSFSSNSRRSDGYYQYQFIRGATTDTLLERNLSYQNTINTARDFQQHFIGDFRIGKLRNRMVAGVDYLNQTINNNNSPYIVFDSVSGLSPQKKYAAISLIAVQEKIASSAAAPTKNNASVNVYSAFVSDVLNITDDLLAMVSLRVDHFESKGTRDLATNAIVNNTKYSQTALSPRFGIVYQVVKDHVSLFGNYLNGFSYVPPVTQPLPDISGTFKPQQANQLEGGVKVDAFDGRLSMTASYYDIKVDNVTRSEVLVRENVNYNITVQNGTQLSKGVELEVIANPLPGLNLIAGYAHNNSKLTKSTSALEGRRPPAAGPEDLVNVWISYALTKGVLKGLGIGFGGNHVSKHLTANSAVTGVFTLPTYTLLNATAYYDVKRFRIGVKLDNITDVNYFIGQGVLSPQLPRNFAASIAAKF